ncbi:DUF5658 family protein [Planctomycetaceae bacterium]|jgi:hypothetical protein|nr:DUF5658 family protein [bacterium]MDB4786549.1 DUF5658 family protein [Planctomycetaceae bacterium]MDC0262261.1 DUF5658 family protein [Planctomycetaceae bacterium]MDC0273671.1 DUF5658 family protein [Planctomycetaceae bacterium]MDG2388186.1 DUF5658 family protein [Planctomycetaceae bacterium]
MDERERRAKPKSDLRRLLTGHLPFERETSVFILVSMLDVFMTYILLRSGHFRESNPIADFFIRHWGGKGMIYFKLSMTAFVCVLTQIIALKKPSSAEFVLRIGTLIVGCVVIYSLVLLIRSVVML